MALVNADLAAKDLVMDWRPHHILGWDGVVRHKDQQTQRPVIRISVTWRHDATQVKARVNIYCKTVKYLSICRKLNENSRIKMLDIKGYGRVMVYRKDLGPPTDDRCCYACVATQVLRGDIPWSGLVDYASSAKAIEFLPY